MFLKGWSLVSACIGQYIILNSELRNVFPLKLGISLEICLESTLWLFPGWGWIESFYFWVELFSNWLSKRLSNWIAVIAVAPRGRASPPLFSATCRRGLWDNTMENDPLAQLCAETADNCDESYQIFLLASLLAAFTIIIVKLIVISFTIVNYGFTALYLFKCQV